MVALMLVDGSWLDQGGDRKGCSMVVTLGER